MEKRTSLTHSAHVHPQSCHLSTTDRARNGANPTGTETFGIKHPSCELWSILDININTFIYQVNVAPSNSFIFTPPRRFPWRILRRRGCPWTPLANGAGRRDGGEIPPQHFVWHKMRWSEHDTSPRLSSMARMETATDRICFASRSCSLPTKDAMSRSTADRDGWATAADSDSIKPATAHAFH